LSHAEGQGKTAQLHDGSPDTSSVLLHAVKLAQIASVIERPKIVRFMRED
jgi:hypothetical protein